MNYQTAELQLREKLALSDQAIGEALADFSCGGTRALDSIREVVILSTCNRVEFYLVSHEAGFEQAEEFLRACTGTEGLNLEDSFYRMSGRAAVRHLFEVASGLNSMVLGEPQILGQVAAAFTLAQENGASGKVLEKMFHGAIRAGKRARTETKISQNPASVSSQAVQLASEIVPDLSDAVVAVLGTGEMAELALQSLVKRGVHEILVINRTLEPARELAERWNGQSFAYENFQAALGQADILISSTGAPHTLIHRQVVAQVMQARPDRPLVILDIAVPRDVEAEVDQVPAVSVYDLDAIHVHLDQSLSEREAQVPDVQEIIDQEESYFFGFLKTLEVLPLIGELHQYLEDIRREELDRTLCRCETMCEEDLERIEAMTEAMIKKFLHQPITRLKQEAGGSEAADYAGICRNLFGLNGGNSPAGEGS
jgi:glutamyl-tRNA reductase